VEFVAEAPVAPVPHPAGGAAASVAVPEHVVPEGVPQTQVDLEEPAAPVPAASEEIVAPAAASNAFVIEEGVSHSDCIVEESTKPLPTPAQESVTLPSLPVETDHREIAANAPAESNFPAVEDVSVGVEEAADAPVVDEPSVVVQSNLEEEKPEAEVVEETLVTPPAPTDETVVPPVPDTPAIEEGIPQAEFTTEARATPALDEETDAEGPRPLAFLQASTEQTVASPASPDTPVAGEGIFQAEPPVEEPLSTISGSVEESAVEEPLLEIEESVPQSAEEAEIIPAVPEAAVEEEGMPQAEVVAEGSEVVVSPAAPAPVEGISQAEIVEDLDAPLLAPAEETVVLPSPAIESDHVEAVAVSTLPAAVPEASSEADTPVIVEEAAGDVGVEGPDGFVDEPLVEAPSAPVEIEADPPALVAPAANEETVPVEVSVPVESVLTVPQASEESSVPAVAIEDLAEADTPPVGAAANSEEEEIGSLVEPEVPQAAVEPAVVEEQGIQDEDEDSPPPAPEGRAVPLPLTSLKLTSLSI